MFKNLLSVVDQRKRIGDSLEQKKAKFDDSIAVLVGQMNDLADKEERLREEAILTLEKENKESIEEDGKIVIRQIKKTKQIDNPRFLFDSFFANRNKFTALNIDFEKILNSAMAIEMVVKDRKAVLDLVDKFEKVEGNLLAGVIVKETKFITIKNSK